MKTPKQYADDLSISRQNQVNVIRAAQMEALDELEKVITNLGFRTNGTVRTKIETLRAEIMGEGEKLPTIPVVFEYQPLYVRLDSLKPGTVFEFAPWQPDCFPDEMYGKQLTAPTPEWRGDRLVRVVELPKVEAKPEAQRIHTTYGQQIVRLIPISRIKDGRPCRVKLYPGNADEKTKWHTVTRKWVAHTTKEVCVTTRTGCMFLLSPDTLVEVEG